MTSQAGTVVLVIVGRHKKSVKFSGSNQNLVAAIADKFDLASERISHLQIWSKDFDDYLDLEEEDEIPNKSKINVELKVNEATDQEASSGDQEASQECRQNVVSYCTEFLENSSGNEETDEGSRLSGAVGASIPKSKLWTEKEVLKVYFLNADDLDEWNWRCGPDRMTTTTIMAWASGAWNSPFYKKIPKLELTEIIDKADVRVKFTNKGGCWSMVGRDALNIATTKPTMSLNLRHHSYDTQKSLVIHEFGHALGLEHEHQRSDFWSTVKKHIDIEKMKDDLRLKGSKPKNGKSGFDTDWFDKKAEITLSESEYDPQSIMHYWFDVQWLRNRQYHHYHNIDRDPSLSALERKCLKGIHERNNSFAKCPSHTDIKCLQQAYGGQLVTEVSSNESNHPSPDECVLLERYHVHYIVETIKEASRHWWHIGKELGIDELTLNNMLRSARGTFTPEKPLTRVLCKWIDRGGTKIYQLCEVLRSPLVARGYLANKIVERRVGLISWKPPTLVIHQPSVRSRSPSPYNYASGSGSLPSRKSRSINIYSSPGRLLLPPRVTSHQNEDHGFEVARELTSMPAESGIHPAINDQLASLVEEVDIPHLAMSLGSTINNNDYLTELGLTFDQKSKVQELADRQGTQTAITEALRMWKAKDPYSATFRALTNVFTRLKDGKGATEIWDYLRSRGY